ncbi:TatD family hydrolase, partial [Clostridium perfringens]
LIEDQAAVLSRARERGVGVMLNIATREREWDDIVATAEREPDVWASVGIHPHEADQHPHADTAKLVARAQHPRVVGIGESGLDYFY